MAKVALSSTQNRTGTKEAPMDCINDAAHCQSSEDGQCERHLKVAKVASSGAQNYTGLELVGFSQDVCVIPTTLMGWMDTLEPWVALQRPLKPSSARPLSAKEVLDELSAILDERHHDMELAPGELCAVCGVEADVLADSYWDFDVDY